jgi:hypothetical protein
MASFKLTPQMILVLAVLVSLGIGFALGKGMGFGYSMREGFSSVIPMCAGCTNPAPQCTCKNGGQISQLVCPPCRQPDMSKYVLKTTVPACPKSADMSQYMLKTQCPPVPDLSKYVLKSSIPKQQPVIIDTSACTKDAGECPPCPRPRCPEVKCPPAQSCPPPAPCPRAVCPPTTVKCKAEGNPDSTVRPYLAPLNMSVFGD